MLKSLKMHNFKTFLNTEIRFGRQHLVIGRNNSGKTNLANLLRFLATTTVSDLSHEAGYIPGGIDEFSNWKLKSGQTDICCTCELDINGAKREYTYELHLERSSADGARFGWKSNLRVIGERLVINSGQANETILLESNGKVAHVAIDESQAPGTGATLSTAIPAPSDATMLSKVYEMPTNRRMTVFREYLGTWKYFTLSPFWMRYGSNEIGRSSTGSQANPTPVHWMSCDPLGENLSNAIYHLKNVDEKRYRTLLKHVKIVEPGLEAILHQPVPGRYSPIPFVQMAGRDQASWDGLSDGTLRMLGLALIIETAAAFSPPNVPGSCLSIIEEPENGIFPGVLRRIFDLFEEWAATAQFIFTSHSPYMIDMFDDKRECVTILKKATDHSEHYQPPKAIERNGDEGFSLSAEYASELF